VCVHGDVINAPDVLDGLHAALEREGIVVRSALDTHSEDAVPLRQQASA
jgi:hypothetical protein